MSGNAAGQDAAETAQILSGVGQSQGGAGRSLGANISRSIGGAANTLKSRPSAGYATSRRKARPAHEPNSIPANVDVLEGTDAPTYRLSNGSSIKVSGRLIQAPETSCVRNCLERRVP